MDIRELEQVRRKKAMSNERNYPPLPNSNALLLRTARSTYTSELFELDNYNLVPCEGVHQRSDFIVKSLN
jgi:hypothetical protein